MLAGISPASARPGETVTLHGKFFTTPDDTQATATVLFGASSVNVRSESDRQITARVPWDAQPGDVAVQVQTSAGGRSDPVTMRIESGPAITSVVPSRVRPPTTIRITGRGFITVDRTSPSNAVTIDGRAIDAERLSWRSTAQVDHVEADLTSEMLEQVGTGVKSVVVFDSEGRASAEQKIEVLP